MNGIALNRQARPAFRGWSLFLLVIIPALFYFVSDYYFFDAMLYLIGGGMGVLIGGNFGMNTFALIWFSFLAAFILLLYKTRYRILKYFAIVLIACLLHIVNIIVYDILHINTANITAGYLLLAAVIIMKTLALILIVFFAFRKKVLAGK